MAKCNECGAVVADDLKFCGYCGAKLNVIGEHLGTRILSNTEVIVDALELLAPGMAKQYTVLGSVSDGPMAGGLILGHRENWTEPLSLVWSDGERLTNIAADHLRRAFDEGTLTFDRGFVATCGVCLARYHRTRGVRSVDISLGSGGGVSYEPGGRWRVSSCRMDSWEWPRNSAGVLSSWILEYGSCPHCSSSVLLSDEYRQLKSKAIKSSIESTVVEAERESREHHEDGRSRRRSRADRRQSEESARYCEELAMRLRSTVNRVDEAIVAEQQVLKAATDAALAAPLEPVVNSEEWMDYQSAFSTLVWKYFVTFPRGGSRYGHFAVQLLPALAETAWVRSMARSLDYERVLMEELLNKR